MPRRRGERARSIETTAAGDAPRTAILGGLRLLWIEIGAIIAALRFVALHPLLRRLGETA